MRGCNPIFDFARLRPPTAPNKMRATSKLNFLSVANKMRRPRKLKRNLRAPKGSAQSAPAVGGRAQPPARTRFKFYRAPTAARFYNAARTRARRRFFIGAFDFSPFFFLKKKEGRA